MSCHYPFCLQLVAPVEVGAVTPVIEETTGESVAKEIEESPGADRQFKDAAQVRHNKLNSQFVVSKFSILHAGRQQWWTPWWCLRCLGTTLCSKLIQVSIHIWLDS